MNIIIKNISPILLYGAVSIALLVIYQDQIKIINQEVLVRDIDSNCDIVIVTTEFCPNCKQAKTYLASQGVS